MTMSARLPQSGAGGARGRRGGHRPGRRQGQGPRVGWVCMCVPDLSASGFLRRYGSEVGESRHWLEWRLGEPYPATTGAGPGGERVGLGGRQERPRHARGGRRVEALGIGERSGRKQGQHSKLGGHRKRGGGRVGYAGRCAGTCRRRNSSGQRVVSPSLARFLVWDCSSGLKLSSRVCVSVTALCFCLCLTYLSVSLSRRLCVSASVPHFFLCPSSCLRLSLFKI